MTRAHLADPHIARKIAEGREARDPPLRRHGLLHRLHLCRPGALHPQPGDRARGDDAACRARDPTGREGKSSSSAPGPGGLEAARVAGERGHEVVVFEAAAQAGRPDRARRGAQAPARDHGHRRLARRANASGSASPCASTLSPRRDDVLGRRVRTSSSSPPAACRTSSSSTRASEFATSSWDILTGAAKPSGEVIVYDDNGAHPGVSAAEFVAESGAKLEIVTPERMLAPDVGGTSLSALFPRLQPRRRRRSR